MKSSGCLRLIFTRVIRAKHHWKSCFCLTVVPQVLDELQLWRITKINRLDDIAAEHLQVEDAALNPPSCLLTSSVEKFIVAEQLRRLGRTKTATFGPTSSKRDLGIYIQCTRSFAPISFVDFFATVPARVVLRKKII